MSAGGGGGGRAGERPSTGERERGAAAAAARGARLGVCRRGPTVVSARGAAGFGEGLNLPSLSQTALKKKKKRKTPPGRKTRGRREGEGCLRVSFSSCFVPVTGTAVRQPGVQD